MKEVMKLDERAGAWASAWITAMLSISASVAIAFGVWMALDTADTEPLESPLILSVARQLDHGPWGLYGPFGRQNPLVLIHAPLYYHLAAILAYPFKSAGVDAITAARVAGRAISLFALLVTLWSASGSRTWMVRLPELAGGRLASLRAHRWLGQYRSPSGPTCSASRCRPWARSSF